MLAGAGLVGWGATRDRDPCACTAAEVLRADGGSSIDYVVDLALNLAREPTKHHAQRLARRLLVTEGFHRGRSRHSWGAQMGRLDGRRHPLPPHGMRHFRRAPERESALT
jgi:hypothetical protein